VIHVQSTAGRPSAWAPLRVPFFRWLWLGVLVSNIGIWMQTVGAQWLLVRAPNASALVALVQTASALPIMLLALPAGALADLFDRRLLLIFVQVYLFGVSVLLAALTAAGQMQPGLLLALTFALGAGLAVQTPGWQATIPELVPRPLLPSAAALGGMNVNLARAVGPAVAGLLIARLGVPAVFAANALTALVFGAALVLWRRAQPNTGERREHFLPALLAGGRYVRHAPIVRRLLLRAAMFIAPAMALWALLPLVASQRLGLGADGYGVMLGALGVGAVAGVIALAPVRGRLSSNAMLAWAGLLYAVVLAVAVLVPSLVAVLVVLVFAGLAWVAVLSTMNAELQLFLPVWVRARGLAVYAMVLFGAQAAGALLWGLVAERAGLQAALLISSAAMLAGVVAGLVWRLADTTGMDRSTAVYWSDTRLAFDPRPETGPVLVSVEYTVAPDKEAAFLAAMDSVRRSRLRTGGTRWELYRDGEHPDRFVEAYRVPTWDEHLRQHGGRMTGSDRQSEEAADALSDPPPRVSHLLPPSASPVTGG
jgi:MFS family permease